MRFQKVRVKGKVKFENLKVVHKDNVRDDVLPALHKLTTVTVVVERLGASN